MEVAAESGGSAGTLAVAGDSLNTAVYLARLGIRAAFATVLGADSPARRIRSLMQDDCIDASFVLEKSGGSTGLYLSETDLSGERHFTYWRDQSAARDFLRMCRAAGLVDRLCDVPVMYLTGITLAVMSHDHGAFLQDMVRKVRSSGGRVAFDPNYRAALWHGRKKVAQTLIGWMCDNADWCLATDSDQTALWGDQTARAAFMRLATRAGCEVVVKCGADGCLIGPDDRVVIPAPVAVIDTTGAGDSFDAAYLAARLQGASVQEAAMAGHTLSATVIKARGAIVPRGNRDALNVVRR